jgi:transcriptional regulator
MHPNRSFEWTDPEAMLAFVQQISFGTIFAAGPDGLFAVHAPVMADAPGRVRFHISRSNRAAAALEGGRALLSCVGPDAYISPDWYGTPDQVPTWNYLAVEAEGPLRPMEEVELIVLLDDLSAEQETRLAPKTPWTRDKLNPRRFDAMLRAIVGYEMTIETLRGTRKLGQNKKPAELEGAAAGLEAAGNPAMAALMRAPT